eukprot:CAMPEP_0114692468 /NCGR_PEP_ID=MMETSP0191-20121206/67967_1 /TAXON_ID=126664 /ORGANISM="Sorites sp." /LENGTH=148 /DNA_ID=CAMNT_0001984899 /DNA_START=71 /DNA_END=518 /DNA_ORIENTATION=+
MSLRSVFFVAAEDKAKALRGTPGIEGIDEPTAEQLTCSGWGELPPAPACFGGTILTSEYHINVVSVDGNVGLVDLQAVGPTSAECKGVRFQDDHGTITVENDEGCGLSNYEYQVHYCSDQDKLIIDIIKPYDVKVVLGKTTCPAAGEV